MTFSCYYGNDETAMARRTSRKHLSKSTNPRLPRPWNASTVSYSKDTCLLAIHTQCNVLNSTEYYWVIDQAEFATDVLYIVMNFGRSCCVGELQPIVQPIRDYLPRNCHYFFKEQDHEKFKKTQRTGVLYIAGTSPGSDCDQNQEQWRP